MIEKQKEVAPPPGIIKTLANGFDVTVKHLWLLLLPVALDLFFWLGPRLNVGVLIEEMAAFWRQEPTLAELSSQFLALAPRTNLFTSLSVPFVGVPALMTGIAPEKTPLPTTAVTLSGLGQIGLWFVLLTLLGLLLTAVYYMTIAASVEHYSQEIKDTFSWHRRLSGWTQMWVRLLVVALVFVCAVFFLYIPLLFIGVVLALLSPLLTSAVWLMGAVLVFWILIFLFFTPHSLALYGRSWHGAIQDSVRLVRGYLTSTLSLLLVVVLLGSLVDWLLILADDGSWLTLSSILGHAFISTALLAATFLFFRDRYQRLFAEQYSSLGQNKRLINGE